MSENIKLILVEEQVGMQGLFRRYAYYYYYMHINLSNFVQLSSSEVFSNLLLIKDEVLLTVSCPIFPSILIAKNLLTGSLKNRSIDNLETQKKSISMKNSQFFRKWPFSGEDDRGKTVPRALVFTRCDIQSERL